MFTFVDFLILVILGGLFYLDAKKGLVYSLFSLFSFVAGVWVASRYFAQTNDTFIAFFFSNPTVRNAISFVQLFLVTMLLVRLLGKLVKKIFNFVGAGLLDTIAGGIFGIMKGTVFVSVCLLLYLSLYPVPGKIFMSRSAVARHFLPVMDFINYQMPHNLNDHITRDLSSIKDWIRLAGAGFANLSKLSEKEINNLLRTLDNQEISDTIKEHFK